MKVKYSVIPFIPVTIAMLAIKVMSIFSVDSNGLLFGLNKTSVFYLSIFLGLGLFVICVLFNILDRKTAPVYRVKKNFAAGVFAILSGLAVAGSAFLKVISTTPDNSDYYFMSLAVAVFSIPACIALILMSKVHFSGKTTVSAASMLYIFPALWGCSGLVSEFLAATKVSISASDMTPLFCYIFVTLYLFSHSMIVSRVKGRNPVKACFIYGLPAVALALSYGTYAIIIAVMENMGIQHIAFGAQFVLLGLYALSFIIEMFTGTITKDEIEIIDSLPEEEDTYENSYIKSGAYDELMQSNRAADDSGNDGNSESAGYDLLGDFVTGYTEDDEDSQYAKRAADMAMHDVIITASGSDNVTGIAQDITASDLISELNSKKTGKKKKKSTASKKAEVNASDTVEKTEEPEIMTEPEVEIKTESEEAESLKSEPQPKSEKNPESNMSSLSSDFSEEDLIGQDRLSQIDRLLAELENNS